MSRQLGVRRYRHQRPGPVALLVGVAFAVVVLLTRSAVGVRSDPAANPLFALWVLGGGILVGSTFAYLALTRRLLVPPLAIGLLFAWATVETWQYYATLDGAVPGTFPIPYSVFTTFWPLVFALGALLAALEYGVRRATNRLPGANPP